VDDTTLSTEFKFDLEGEIAKIKSTPANPANVANLKDSEEANSQNSQDSQPAPVKVTFQPEPNSQDSQNSQRYPEVWQFLTDLEREVWRSYYNSAVGPKFGMSPEDASRKATDILVGNMNALQGEEIEQSFKQDGYIKIFSTRLGQSIYLCRDSIVAKKVPDSTITVFTLRELKALDGLDDDEALLLLEAKVLFGGQLMKPKPSN